MAAATENFELRRTCVGFIGRPEFGKGKFLEKSFAKDNVIISLPMGNASLKAYQKLILGNVFQAVDVFDYEMPNSHNIDSLNSTIFEKYQRVILVIIVKSETCEAFVRYLVQLTKILIPEYKKKLIITIECPPTTNNFINQAREKIKRAIDLQGVKFIEVDPAKYQVENFIMTMIDDIYNVRDNKYNQNASNGNHRHGPFSQHEYQSTNRNYSQPTPNAKKPIPNNYYKPTPTPAKKAKKTMFISPTNDEIKNHLSAIDALSPAQISERILSSKLPPKERLMIPSLWKGKAVNRIIIKMKSRVHPDRNGPDYVNAFCKIPNLLALPDVKMALED